MNTSFKPQKNKERWSYNINKGDYNEIPEINYKDRMTMEINIKTYWYYHHSNI